MTTGVDAQTCKLIVLDSNIGSMTEFKQIIGRGTRINEDFGKYYFTIMDFRNVTALFADKEFDGDPVRVKEAREDDDISDAENETDDTPVIDDADRRRNRVSAAGKARYYDSMTSTSGPQPQSDRQWCGGHHHQRARPIHGSRWQDHHRESA